ncbi:hypothetical protein G3N56_17910 [Desulfovibrio sulfodismutans]|uniref:Uncharacterized protein n=1 Tax=Desulfolutivibrio sulfodismutans TaxID=63561 RepID=A0A7K3NQX2_9BACT|nr:hypothetical protein [Desulfolutivibrio sulfodismutans]NDY58614.1 hypothetical protein [Desulfolutivibrio sulfodismutans]QLA10837.1 hypothetical protein GD606_00355 [Desulfolutivibrio sulfodismutans DSM 3696]
MRKSIILCISVLLFSSLVWAGNLPKTQGSSPTKSGKKVECKGYNPKTDKMILDEHGNCIGYWTGTPDGDGFQYDVNGELEARTYPDDM